MAYMDSYYVLSLNILKALGGDTSIIYPDADAIWDEINKIYNNAGNRFDIVPLEKNITENGQYDYYPDGDADAFMPVNINVNVPQKYTDEQVFEIESNAIQQGYNQGYVEGEADGKLTGREEGYTDGYNTGYGTGVTDGGNAQKAKLVDITITENGVYTKDDGYKTVTVEVEGGIPEEELQQMLKDAMDEGYQDGYAEGVDDGFVDGVEDQKSKLESTTFTENGTYTKEDGWNEVTVEVDVPTFETETLSVELKSNGNYNYTPTTDGYSSVSVTVDVDTSGGGKPKIYNGISVFPSNGILSSTKNVLSNMDFSKYDWSKVYDGYYFLANLNEPGTGGWTNFEENFNGRFLSGNYMFSNISSNTYAMSTLPNIKEKMDGVLTMRGMFQKNKNIRNYADIANWDTSKCVDTSMMFNECPNANMLLFDVSSVVTAESMFYSVKQSTTIPQYNFEKLIYAPSMFYGCGNLTRIPEFNTSNIRWANSMFYNCSSTSLVISELNWENLRNCNTMFGYTKFTELPNMNTKNVLHFGTSTSSSWLYENRSITKMGIIDCDSCINIGFVLSPNTTMMTELGGFRNLGKMPSLTGCDGSYFLSKQPNLTYDSIMNVINLLYDRASAGYSVLTLKLHANHLAMLSDDDIAIATNKGWTIA